MPRLRTLTLLAALLAAPLAAAPAWADQAPAAAAAGTRLTTDTWPPALTGADAKGTVTLRGDEFLKVPESVSKEMDKPGFAPFVVAKEAPAVDVAYHTKLPDAALNGTGWSSWGDIVVARDGKVYCGLGDHGEDVKGKGHVFIYQWDPEAKALTQVLDPNTLPARSAGDVTFSKVHAGLQEAKDGRILIITTLNDGGTAGQVTWSANVPGSPILAYDPSTKKAELLTALDKRCSATTLMDHAHNLLYLCLEGNEDKDNRGSALAAFDPESKKLVYRSPDAVVAANRNIAMDREGAVYFNGKGGELWRYDPQAKAIAGTGMVLPNEGGKPEGQATMRSSTAQGKDGWVYGSTMGPGGGKLFRFNPQAKKVEMLGNDFGHGEYTTVSVLSPDEKYVYYLPGAHNGAMNIGTPVVQYNVATGQRKVLAFLRPYFEKQFGYVPAGSYGVKLSADGSTLYANLNGHTRDDLRPEKMTASGFGHSSFVAIHIPESERK